MDSILTSIKKLLGIMEEDKNFDSDIIMHINSVFAVLNQIGVGPEKGFSIMDEYATWSEYIIDKPNLEFVKSYMAIKVKLLFDPPLSSSHIEALNRQAAEFEWRILTAVDLEKPQVETTTV